MAYMSNENLYWGGTLSGTDEADTLDGTFFDIGGAYLWLIGGLGNDTYLIDNSTFDVIVEEASGGIDTVRSTTDYQLTAFVENLVLLGTGNIAGYGNGLANALTGNSGDNLLNGFGGNDTMAGGLGDDQYHVDSTLDVVIEAANAGTDTVFSTVSYVLGANVERLEMDGALALAGTGNAADNIINGSVAGNTIKGLAGNDILNGADGNDILEGGEGNDRLNGEAGADILRGGAGDDLYIADAQDIVEELAGAGSDTVRTQTAYTLTANVENLEMFGSNNTLAALTGNALNNRIFGNGFDNLLFGLAGNDTLDGQGGADTMTGGAGNDLYYVDNASDKIVEKAGEGIDKVIVRLGDFSHFYALSANVENLVIAGDDDVNANGNALNNAMTGNGSRNVLRGFDGDDILDGGGNSDSLHGGKGNDTYYFDNIGDQALEMKDEGTDTVFTSVGYNFYGSFYIENMTLTGTAHGDIIGNDQNNVINGNAGNNLLDGRGGADTMSGGLGDDTYVVDRAFSDAALSDKVIEGANAGIDTVIAYMSYALTANVENLTLGGTAEKGTGNILNNVIRGNSAANEIDGKDGNDTLYGFGGDDLLKGGAGNDILDGGTGSDALQGGAGDDIYYVDNPGDAVTEALNAGVDSVRSSLETYNLGANVENLELLGSSNIAGTGNALNNRIIGNSGMNDLNGGDGNDILDGGGGADHMTGGAGNDIYIVDYYVDPFELDVVNESPGGGTDTIQISVNRGTYDFEQMVDDFQDLEANVENLVMTGTADLQAKGNGLANTMTGNAGNNVLDGAGGADKLIGGKGNDTYFLDVAGDVVTELANEGIDTVYVNFAPAGGTYTLAATLEVLDFSLNTGVVNGTGNALDNGLIGNDKANKLDGGAGNDYLQGGGGGDTLIGGAGNDFLEANGRDSNTAVRGTLTGGTGDDFYVVGAFGDDPGSDSYERDANIVEKANEGNDSVLAMVDFDMSSPSTGATNVENLYLDDWGYHGGGAGEGPPISWNFDGTGNALDNKIFGNLGSNKLEGGGGNDTFYFHTYTVDFSAWAGVTGESSFTFQGATLDGRDRVYGGTEFDGDSGIDTLYAAITDLSDPGINQLQISGVEDITLYSGSNEGGVNAVDASFIFGAQRITISDMREQDRGVTGASAEITLSNVASDVEVRLDNFTSTFAATLTEDTGNDILNLTLGRFGGDGFGRIDTTGYETVRIKVDQPSDGSDVGAYLYGSDVEHVVLTGDSGTIHLAMANSAADITLDDANLDVLVHGTLLGLNVNLNGSIATLTADDAVAALNIDTMGGDGRGASSLDVFDSVQTSMINVAGSQGLNIRFNQASLDASTMTGDLYTNAAGYGQNIKGGLGNDQINGSDGSDRLNGGGNGNDFLFGGDGNDTFVFEAAPGNPDHNVYIVDFQSGIDRIELGGGHFGPATEPVSGTEFYVGDPAGISGHNFIFDQDTGSLYYDQDGTAGGAQLIATLLNGHTIQAGDITVV